MARTQKNFYADEDVAAFLDRLPHGEQSKLINEAIRALMGSPSFEKRIDKQLSAIRKELTAMRGKL